MKCLVIDQSTTSTTAILFSETDAPQTLSSEPHRSIYANPGWVEHDANEILANIRAALATGKAAGAQAFGLANQGESCLAWDAQTKAPLSPIIVWQDSRTAETCAALEAAGHADAVRARSGLQLSPYFSATKLAWCYDNVPNAKALAQQGRLRVGTTDAFFRDALTGRCETDVATASRTSLMNLHSGEWDVDLCALFGVPMQCLPAIGDCNGDLGAANGVPLRSSIVDQQAALFGHGMLTPGGTKITLGTGAFALTFLGAALPAHPTAAVPTVAWREAGHPLQYALDGGVFTASSALDWAKGLGLFSDYGALEALPTTPAIAGGLVFVPSLSGLGCPHWQDGAKGSWLGLTLGTPREALVQSLLEGVAFRVAEVVDEIETHCPVSAPIGLDGGLSQNMWLCQFLSNVLNKPVRVSAFTERTGLGVAMLAARSLGETIAADDAHTMIAPKEDLSGFKSRFAKARHLIEEWADGTAQ